MTRYEHAGGAKATTLASGITAAATSSTISDATNWPTGASNPFWVVFNRGKASEEKVLVASRTGTLLSGLTRGQDGTSAASHDAGATVEHCLTATEIDKFDAVVEDPAANWNQGNAAYAPLASVTTEEGFRAYRSSAQALTAATWTKLVCNTEVRDDGADYDPATGEWTVPATGWYDVATTAMFVAIGAGERAVVSIYIGGVENTRLGDITAGAGGDHAVGGSRPLYLTAGDVVAPYVFCSGTGRSIGAAATQSYFTAKRRYAA